MMLAHDPAPPVRAAALVALIAGIACGGPSDEPARDATTEGAAGVAEAGAAGVDPCLLLTADDVREVTGSEPGEPAPAEPAEGVRICNWSLVSDPQTPILSVMAFPAPVTTYDQYLEQSREAFGEGFDPSHYEEVQGLGESAVWSAPTLQAWGDGHMVQIQSGVGGPALDRDASVELARRALDRL